MNTKEKPTFVAIRPIRIEDKKVEILPQLSYINRDSVVWFRQVTTCDRPFVKLALRGGTTLAALGTSEEVAAALATDPEEGTNTIFFDLATPEEVANATRHKTSTQIEL